ncbi:MAG: hypothetical protein ACI86M_003878 [Saprospiraceae bacterium]|jgi:hypothetical protein
MKQKTLEMEGILYLTDDDNKKKFVQIDLEKYGRIVEDILDSLVIESRRGEESYPIEEVLSELKNTGNLDKYV